MKRYSLNFGRTPITFGYYAKKDRMESWYTKGNESL